MTNLEKDFDNKFEDTGSKKNKKKEDTLEAEESVTKEECCGCESECAPESPEQEIDTTDEELDYHAMYLQAKVDIEKLKWEFNEYRRKNEQAVKDLNEQFIQKIEKKSSEASAIIQAKVAEIENKYKEEFQQKKDFIHEPQLVDLVELISQFENILKIETKSPEVQNFLTGFQMFLVKFKNLLSDFKISEVITKVGDVFNSDEMVSAGTKEVKEEQKNTILKVYSNGFKLNGKRMIKLSSVLVGV